MYPETRGASLPEAQCFSMVVVEGCSEKCRCDVVQWLGPALKTERLMMVGPWQDREEEAVGAAAGAGWWQGGSC